MIIPHDLDNYLKIYTNSAKRVEGNLRFTLGEAVLKFLLKLFNNLYLSGWTLF